MADLPWQDGHYRCHNMYADMILVEGSAANMLGMDPPPVLAAGDFGEAGSVYGRSHFSCEHYIANR